MQLITRDTQNLLQEGGGKCYNEQVEVKDLSTQESAGESSTGETAGKTLDSFRAETCAV